MRTTSPTTQTVPTATASQSRNAQQITTAPDRPSGQRWTPESTPPARDTADRAQAVPDTGDRP